ncbi:hypothetical protein [Streptomyces beigongshangae]|uniref:hypothetical protein n=1 Tax=Streptomyces beigongshangae TaxID=2841597 RepID=UPI001C85CCB7|nr:hypothetical protein [Streptomyces sp. REN17]
MTRDSGLAVAEAHRRPGRVGDADRARRTGYRAARASVDLRALFVPLMRRER